jgi:hypothetical protein
MVGIDIDLKAGDVQAKIAQIKLQLEELEDDFDFDIGLDGDLGDKLSDLGDKLEDITDGLTSDLDDSIDRLENLDIDPVIIEGNGDSGGDTGSDSGDGHDRKGFGFKSRTPTWRQLEDLGKKQPRDTSGSFADAIERIRDKVPGGYATKADDATTPDKSSWNPYGKMRGVERRIARGDYSIGDMSTPGTLSLLGDGDQWDVGTDGNTKGFFSMLEGSGSKIQNGFRKLIPNMQMWWNIIGALLPALGAFAVQAAGVAAAMGSVAVAGGALLGLGLIGHGESMSEAWGNAKNTLSELKTELFQTFQPSAQLFAPIADQFFDALPGQLDKVNDSMEGLTQFDGVLMSGLEGGTDILAEFFNIINRNGDKISEMSKIFGSILGETVLNLFEWLLNVGYENMNMLMRLGKSLGLVAVTLFNVFMIVGRATGMLLPFFKVLAGIADFLNGPITSTIFGIIVAFFILSTAITNLYPALVTLGSIMMGSFTGLFSLVQGVTFQILTATSATYAFAQAIATAVAAATMLAGIGLVAWTGYQAMKGMNQANKISERAGGSGRVPGGNTYNTRNNYQIDMHGQQDNAQKEGLADLITQRESREPPYGN